MPPSCTGRFDRQKGDLGACTPCARKECKTPVLTLLEVSSAPDYEVGKLCYENNDNLGTIWDRERQAFSTSEINFTLDSERLEPIHTFGLANGLLDSRNQEKLLKQRAFPLAEGRSFWHFDLLFSDAAKYAVPFDRLKDRPHWFRQAQYYRAVYRRDASSTNERTMIWTLLPPGIITAESCPSERAPWNRTNAEICCRLAILNSYVSDYLLRMRVGTNVNQFILRLTPLPQVGVQATAFLSHCAARLLAQDERFLPFWSEQFGETWRETGRPASTFPVCENDPRRWLVRAAADASVADAYGLSRDQYAHVLSTFSHTSYPKAPELCLAMFDELKAIGLEAFTKKHDPYWDIPLNENLPQPVIDLPVAEAEQSTVGDPALGPQFRLSDKPARQRAKRKR